MLEYTSRKQHLRRIKKKKREAKHSLGKKKRTLHKNGRSNLHHTALGKTGEYWHTIYVKQDNKSSCNDICEKNKFKISCKRKKEKKLFYIIVPNPLFNAEKENWISFNSGFKYCHRMHFVIDAACLNHMKKITSAVELHFYLSHLSVDSVHLIQPYNCHRVRFCIVNSHQFSILRENNNVETMSTESNTYLYEYTDVASWSLPGCVVSSWESNNGLPEFSMKDVDNLVQAVGLGTKRKRTQNRGIFVSLGPRLSSRPRPNPVIQDKNKLHFSDFYRQNWNSQDSMYLLCHKFCHGTECVRKRSIALNPMYMRLVGHHCCARQLLSSGIYKCDGSEKDVHSKKSKNNSKKNSVVNTLGYVNSLHLDTCDLILKSLVPLYIAKFIRDIKSSKKYHFSEKRKLIKKVEEISSLVGMGLPTTCGHNIICDSKLKDIASLSSLFIMFDFAMTLGHKTVHNFLPGLLFTVLHSPS